MNGEENRLFTALLKKMLREVNDILAFTQGMSKEAFADDLRTQKAVAMSFVNLGEYAGAARRKCESCVKAHPEIPFAIMAGLRNVTAHEYEKIDFDTLFATVEKDIPILKRNLEQALS